MSKEGDEAIKKSFEPTVVDVMSPYFISGSDNPNIIFTSDLLRDDNYADWADEMSNALYAKNKYGFVDGSIPIPKEGSSEWSLWKRCNAVIRGWLQTSMNKEIRSSVKHAKTAQEVWEDLRERFGNASAPRAFELKREITLTRQGKLSVSAYYTKLKGLWDEFQATSPIPKCKCGNCACDIGKQLTEMRDKERLYEFLMGLDDIFGTVKTQILSTRPMVSLGAAFHIVSEDERQKQITTAGRVNVDVSAFQITRREEREAGDRKDNQREPKKCTHCGKLYHNRDECYELKGYPKPDEKGYRENGKKEESWKKQKNTPKGVHMVSTVSPIPEISNDHFAQCWDFFKKQEDVPREETLKNEKLPTVNMASKINNLKSWIIDSGATEHITCDDGILTNQTRIGTETPVKIPNGEKVHVVSIGETNLPNGIKLTGVLNIPNFECNLMSVSRLTRDLNCSLTFFADYCILQDLPSRKMIGMGRNCDGLYFLELMNKEKIAMSVSVDSRT